MNLTPYVESSLYGYSLYERSCFDSSSFIKDESVNVFFLDPPYFITNIDWDNVWSSKEEYYQWCESWIKLVFNQLKPTGSAYICCQWQHSGAYQNLLESCGFVIQNRMTWKRDKGRGSKTNWKQMHEDIWFVTKSKEYIFNIDEVKIKKKVIAPYRDEQGQPKDWWIENGEKVRLTHPGNLWDDFVVPFWSCKEVSSYSKSKRTQQENEKHPTQKPKDLVKRCLLASSNEGDLVVDYFGGSGTTLIAAKELKRNCIIFEKDHKYCNMIKTRLENESNDLTLFC